VEPPRVPLVGQEGEDYGMAGLQGVGWQAEEEEEEGRWVEVPGWVGEELVHAKEDAEGPLEE